MLQEKGELEKGQIHRNECDERLVPLCMSETRCLSGIVGNECLRLSSLHEGICITNIYGVSMWFFND
jgi:hypothetical protein